jgi:hypothetical protein
MVATLLLGRVPSLTEYIKDLYGGGRATVK